MNLHVFQCLGRPIRDPAVSIWVRMVFWSLLEPFKLLKPLKITYKMILMEIMVFTNYRRFWIPWDSISPHWFQWNPLEASFHFFPGNSAGRRIMFDADWKFLVLSGPDTCPHQKVWKVTKLCTCMYAHIYIYIYYTRAFVVRLWCCTLCDYSWIWISIP